MTKTITLPTANAENMRSSRGNPVLNQMKIYTDEGVFFQSYSSIIAFRDHAGRVTLDAETWDCSRTTDTYRNAFLGESKRETEAKIKSGEYTLADLNK